MVILYFSDEVYHLGHILTYNLCDGRDFLRVTKDFNRKSNYLLSTFNCVDPSVKSFLLKSFCLSLCGCCKWSLSSPDIHTIQVAINHLLHRIWKLPRHSHTAVCHCLSHVPAVRNQVYKRFLSLHSSAMLSSSPLVKSVFSTSSLLVFTFTGCNFLYGSTHVKTYSDNDIAFASVIYDNICKHFGFNSSHESLVATRYIMLLIMLLLLFLIIIIILSPLFFFFLFVFSRAPLLVCCQI